MREWWLNNEWVRINSYPVQNDRCNTRYIEYSAYEKLQAELEEIRLDRNYLVVSNAKLNEVATELRGKLAQAISTLDLIASQPTMHTTSHWATQTKALAARTLKEIK